MRLATAPPLSLAQDESHVWYCWTDACLDEGRAEAYRALLSADEAERMARFQFDYLKREFLVTRALCRLTLSRYADIPPHVWRFRTNAYGRPEVDLPDAPRLRFNLSNARSLVACVITRDADAGVDVEELDRRGDTLAIADRYFSASEMAALRALPVSRQQERFFELWTLKESYIKARGMGLSIPLDQFSFSFGGRIGIGFDPELEDRSAEWHFELHRPGVRHLLAVGVRRPSTVPWRVQVRATVPGSSE